MGKESTCPGCQAKFMNGRPFSVHISCCKDIDSAANTALKKHKIITAKKTEEKNAQIALAVARNLVDASSSQPFQDGQEIDLDVDMPEVRS
jgi:hypothetical protein